MGQLFFPGASIVLCWTHVCHDDLSGNLGANFLFHEHTIPDLCQPDDVLWKLTNDQLREFQRVFLLANLLPLCAILQHVGL